MLALPIRARPSPTHRVGVQPHLHQLMTEFSEFWDRYTVEREIGGGAMARVFLARDHKHDRPVAVKVLRPEFASGIGAERFLREIKLAARLTHAHILPLYDSGDDDGTLYYVMPFVKDGSLRTRLVREQKLSPEDAVKITRGVVAALDYVHERGIVHRDIKPENFLLQHGIVHVSDFGIGRTLDLASVETLTKTGILLGTPAYMSPEQLARPHTVDGRSDLYSVGCVLYEMLVGEPLFDGTPQKILARRSLHPEPEKRLTDDSIPEVFQTALDRVLATDPEDRFATGAEFVAALVPS